MLLYGAGGHAGVILSALKAGGVPVRAIFDDSPVKSFSTDLPVCGSYDPDVFPEEKLIIAIGNNKTRERIAEGIKHSFGLIVHPSALLDPSAVISEGTVIFHGAIVQASAEVGRHVIVNTRATVDHDCKLGDFVHIAPGTILCGNVRVGAGTLVGAGSIVTPNVSIGCNCLITAGSVVSRPVPDNTVFRKF